MVVDMIYSISWQNHSGQIINLKRKHSEIKKLFEYIRTYYYCHLFPHMPEFSVIPKIRYQQIYFEEKALLMQFFLNKLYTYHIIRNDSQFQYFFSETFQPDNKKQTLVQSTMNLLKNISKKASQSLTEKIKTSLHKSFSKDQLEVKSFEPSDQLTLDDFENKLRKVYENIVELIQEIKKISKILQKSNTQKQNLYIVKDIDDFIFAQSFKQFRKINNQIQSKESECMQKIESKTLIQFKDIRNDIISVISQINVYQKREREIPLMEQNKKNQEQQALQLFLSELGLFYKQQDKNLKDTINEYQTYTSEIDQIYTDIRTSISIKTQIIQIMIQVRI